MRGIKELFMKMSSGTRIVLCLMLAAFLLTANGGSLVLAARVAGQEGVTSAARAEDQDSAQEGEAESDEQEDTRYVTIDFDSVDIRLFIKFIADLTGRNFVVDSAVKGEVTIVSPVKVSVEEAYKVFESVMEVHGFTVVPAGKITKIVPSVEARSKDVELRLRGEEGEREDKVITQLIPLTYADPNELTQLFKPLISKNSIMVPYQPTRMLIVTDVMSNLNRLIRIIKQIDKEGVGREISVIPLEHATAEVMAKTVDTLLQKRGQQGKEGVPGEADIRIVADERTNSLVLLASADDTAMVKGLIDLLDKETPKGEGDIHVYYLQNANAEDLAKVLTTLPSKEGEGEKKGETPVISKDVQIVADSATNSLVITAKKDDFQVLEEVIGKLDITRRMVYIEALLMEVSVTKSFDLGVEWKSINVFGSDEGRDIAAFGASTPGKRVFPSVGDQGVAGFPTGFSMGVLGEGIKIGDVFFPSVGAVVRAYRSDSDVHILSTPQIMTTDNEEAEIQVGKNVPFLTRQDTSQTGIDYSNYEYKDVGVTLNITPQINEERFVRLNISQEVSQVVEEESQLGLPTTLRRLAKTTVIIKDGHTVVIGGLIDDTMTQTKDQVPCLGGITGLGWLFKSTSKSGDRTNLFVFLTPHIIENPEEAKEVYDTKKDEIDKVKEGVIKLY